MINDPSGYYAGEAPSLFWELTVCESLARPESPYRTALREPRAYGEILARFLAAEVGLEPTWSVVEVGAGTGSLMAAFLRAVPSSNVTLVDLSPAFREAQRGALAGRPGVGFVAADAVAFAAGLSRDVDLVICNEVLGDLPTVTGISRGALEDARAGRGGDPEARAVAELGERYGLELTDPPEVFAFNLGAIRFLEALAPRARVVFLSEHGADTVVPPPYDAFLPPPPADGWPRRVPLRGHDEYTVRFDHLERVGRVLGYRTRRLHMAELLGLRTDPGIRAMARWRSTASDVTEAVYEFCEHVAEYQCLVLVREARERPVREPAGAG